VVHSTGNDSRVRRLLPPVLAALLALSCSPAAPTTSASPAPSFSPSAPIPTVVVAPPAAVILDGAQAGLAPNGGSDHLDLAQAASLEQNQPLALTRFRGWGWVDEAMRSWGAGSPSFDERLLLLTRADGARQAFSDLANQWLVPPLNRTACSSGFGLDECAEGSSGGHSILVGRVGTYVVRLDGDGVDLEAEAALQARRLRV
jgi:hypothetical protein